MWSLTDKPKMLKATKALAKEFADMQSPPYDRPLSKSRLDTYKAEHAAGRFRPVVWAKAWCKETGQWYRINGQHTSNMVLQSNGHSPELFALVEEYNCETLEDLGRLYATYDNKLNARTTADVNLSIARTIPALSDTPAATINLAVTGMNYAISQDRNEQLSDNYYAKTPQQRAESLYDQYPFVLWLSDLFAEGLHDRIRGTARYLKRGPTVGAMYLTWQRNPEDAGRFWRLVRDETGVSPDLPCRVLASFLRDTSLNIGVKRAKGAKKKSAGSREMMVCCIHAWNAWRQGKRLTVLRYFASSPIPDVL